MMMRSGRWPERSSHKLARSDGNLAGDSLYGLPPNRVRMRYLQLGGLLDDDEAFLHGHMVKHGPSSKLSSHYRFRR